ncbi:MAG: DNA primase DnaG [Candidatus Pacearchaeota archaeon]|nr:DNA primase DnaG [Candidatus Pacearchaeota archaeon]
MGKISPPSIKYIIKAKFSAEGIVEKPDVIGAIFGQTEGLLGEELELRELQKKGKIGRIEATLQVKDSKTEGIVEIPTSMDKTETTIIAAAIETVDRVGPCVAKFEIFEIEDVRSSKRQYIVERAKVLLEKLAASLPEKKEIENAILVHSKISKVSEYGIEKLPCGPDIEEAEEIIVVEGRADVVNLLKAGIKNVIAMDGASLPRTIKELAKRKKIILFIDGDRGGLLIAKNLIENIPLKGIARAPDGKEVEELTEKEINTCLRNALSVEDFKKTFLSKKRRKEHHKEEGKINFEEIFRKIEGTNSCIVFFDSAGKKMSKKAVGELVNFLYTLKKNQTRIYALVIDGTLTKQVLNLAEQLSCKFIAARNFQATSEKIKFISF